MARVPSAWRQAGAFVREGQHLASSSRPREGSYDGDIVRNGEHDRSAVAAGAPVVQDVDDGEGGFMVMCEDGWFGWYHSCHRRFKVNNV